MPWVLNLIRTRLRITPESARRSIERVRKVFCEVDERLRDGRQFLVGERFTAADLTFASLAAPVLFPADCRAAYPTLDVVPVAMREEALRLRGTDAGRFALRLFLQERGCAATAQKAYPVAQRGRPLCAPSAAPARRLATRFGG